MNNFQLPKGATVKNLDGIHECFYVRELKNNYKFIANVSFENTDEMIRDFCRELEEPCFFILEVPTNEKDEIALREAGEPGRHGDLYYLDGISRARMFEIFDKYGELLLNDGMVRFGFASHASRDEIYIDKYNIVIIYAIDRARYEKFFLERGIPQEEKIKTVYQNFTKDVPGESRRIDIDGKSIYDIVDDLKPEGLHFAERVEQ